jgi:predicted GIY-YIG superfamily endonuclease
MKTHYVYELFNLVGTIEYVGETSNPTERLYNHTKKKSGKFYNRVDIQMNIVKEFDNRKDAYYYQIELQKQYNLVTDSEIKSKTCSITMKGNKHGVGNKAWTGKTRIFSEETKQKMKESAIRRYSTTNT